MGVKTYLYTMNVFVVWLGACRKIREALFASKGAGTQFEAKSVKKHEIPQKGQFNIMQSYGNGELPDKKSELIPSGAAVNDVVIVFCFMILGYLFYWMIH